MEIISKGLCDNHCLVPTLFAILFICWKINKHACTSFLLEQTFVMETPQALYNPVQAQLCKSQGIEDVELFVREDSYRHLFAF